LVEGGSTDDGSRAFSFDVRAIRVGVMWATAHLA
jgi:hypothetical protein